MQAFRSDSEAKNAFCDVLRTTGYSEVRVIAKPADVAGTLNGIEYLFEIKCTSQATKYFGSATLTEWRAAIQSPDRYRFVVACNMKDGWKFEQYTPAEFMQFSYVPPFKIFFSLSVDKRDVLERKVGKATRLTPSRLNKLIRYYDDLRDSS